MIGTLQDTFRGQDRGRAPGLYSVTAGVATALGSPLGGALVAGLGLQLGWSFSLLVSAPGAMLTRSLAPERASGAPCRHPPSPEQRSEA
ncbi:hypothetical protein ACFRLW_42685 [Streptomyces sp. NPDC056728]